MNPKVARALSGEKRVLILQSIEEPVKQFRRQKDGDLADDGVCRVLIAEKLEVTQPTAREHLRILSGAGLLKSTKIKQWIFYKRGDDGIPRATWCN